MQHPTTPREALTMVAELFADPSRWTEGGHHHRDARDAAGKFVDPLCPTAVAWSLDGALARVIAVDAEDVSEAEHWRRIEMERGAYRALGIAPGSEFRELDATMAVLRHGEAAALREDVQDPIASL